MIDKRKTPEMTEQEMYKISPIQDFIDKERRHDQLERLNEVRQQKRVWRNVVLASLSLNLILAFFAIMGYLQDV